MKASPMNGSPETLRLPRPTGPFSIGTVSYHLVDPTRPDRFASASAGARELMVQVWYPAIDEPAAPRAPYLDDGRTLRPLASMMGLPASTFDHLTRMQTNAASALPVFPAEARYPVLIFSHGRCGFRQHNSVQVEELVSHGFVVAAIDHPHMASGVLFPDGRMVAFDRRFLPPWPRSDGRSTDADFEDVVGYLAADVRFVLDRLTDLDRADPLGTLTGRLDLGRVGVFGPSLGGRVAAQAALEDPRIGAALFMDVAMPAAIVAGELRRPAMWISRDRATMERERWSFADIEDTQTTMRLAFEHSERDGYLVLAPGMFHPDFSDGRLLSPLLPERGITGPIDGARARMILNEYSLAFFDRHLRAADAPLLDGPDARFPGVIFARHPGAATTKKAGDLMPSNTHARPALVVVDDRESSRDVVSASLRRRFGSDYDVVAVSPHEVHAKLESMRASGADVALIVANQYLESEPGTALLATTRDVYPTARRLVLTDFGDNWVMPAISRASTLGQVDHFGYMPWTETDEHFLAGVGNILDEWALENGRGEARLTIVGKRDDPGFHLLGEVLQRWQTFPAAMLAADTPEAVAFLAERGISGPLPIVALVDGRIVTGADVAKVSDSVGAGVDTSGTTYDVAILGLGPAGFSAAVNAGSEGMRVIMINSTFSQASSSPKIWNYLGFPAGITGAELMRRAWAHALMFGAVGRIGRTANGLRHQDGLNIVSLDDGSEVTAEVVMLAIGVDYRRVGVESVDHLIGRGVFYGFSDADALALSGLDVAVVGGANSAVQAAISLARDGRAVHLIVRGDAPNASEYLIEQADVLPNLTVHLNTEVVEAKDAQQLRSLTLRDRRTGRTKELAVSGLFIMIGAVPRTDWLPPELARDDKGYVLTGDDAPRSRATGQAPLPFQTTVPGVFALGDVRSGSVKRVAAAVGEGSAAVQQAMRYRTGLAERAQTEREGANGELQAVGGSHRRA